MRSKTCIQLISETTDCDYKAAVEHTKPKSWLKSVSAFANTAGGVLAFGVDDASHEVIGLTDAQSDANFISEKIKERIEPLPRFEIEAASEDGRAVLFVHVRVDAHPPYYYCADGRREAYVRVGNQSVIAPPEVLNELILRGTNRTWDGLDSQIPRNRASFTVLRATYANRMRDSLDEADLESFGLFTDQGTLTNAGALLADEPLLRHSRVFCTRFTGPYENDFADTAEYEGGLLTLLRETQAFVKRHTTESWEKTPDSRIERRSYSTRAVEEVLVNALIHRSYLVLGSEVHVDMYDNRMEIYSPGEKIGAPLPEDVMATRVKSERRNPIIADVFSRMNLMERRGSGLSEICTATAAEDAYKPEFKPVFESKQDAFWVTLWNMNYVEGAATDPVGTHDGTHVSPQVTPHVSPQVERLLAALGDGELTSAELMTAMGFSDRSSFQQNYLKAALESGLVEMTIPDKPKSRNQKYRRAK